MKLIILHIVSKGSTGCSLNIVFFPKILEYSILCPFSVFLGVSVCTHTRQVEHQRCSRAELAEFRKITKF